MDCEKEQVAKRNRNRGQRFRDKKLQKVSDNSSSNRLDC